MAYLPMPYKTNQSTLFPTPQPKQSEKVREYFRRYERENRERLRAYKKAHNKAWIAKHREHYNKGKCQHRFKLKLIALDHYSKGLMCCAHCGYSADVDALCLDHVNNDGAAHRKANKISQRGAICGSNVYERLRSMGWPEIYQVLCFNCNTIKALRIKRGCTSAELTVKVKSGPTHWRKF